MSKKIIGILGGMGPAATADLFTKIINSTEASCDQEHLHVIIDSNTNIPDRTEALIHGGADPTEQMTQSAEPSLSSCRATRRTASTTPCAHPCRFPCST